MSISNYKIKNCIDRIDILKDAVINNYLDEINLDNEIDIYNNIVSHLIKGDLVSYYKSDVFEDMSEKECFELMQLANKYSDLCFCENNYNWLKSIEVGYSKDYEFAFANFLENYDFLLKIAKFGDNKILIKLNEFNNKYNKSCSFIDLLRKRFFDDRALEWILQEMFNANSLYNIFTDSEKLFLLTKPEGVLFFYSSIGDNNVSIKFISPILLALEIHNRIYSSNKLIFNKYNSSDTVILLSRYLRSENRFVSIINDMNMEYITYRWNTFKLSDIYIVNVLKEIDNDVYWSIDSKYFK